MCALDQALDVAQEHVLVDAHERDRLAFGAGAARAADAVHVVLGHVRQVVVDDVRQLVDVDAARRDVGGDHHLDLAGLEVRQRARARVLALVAVQRDGADAVAVQRLTSLSAPCLVRVNTRTCRQRWWPTRYASSSLLSLAVHRVHALRDRVDGGVGRRHLDRAAARSSSLSASALISAENVAENSRFCRCFGSRASTRFTSGMKPMSSMRSASSSTKISMRERVDVALAVVVEQAAGRGDEDVDAALQLRGLRPEADAAEQHHRRDLQVLAVRLDRRLDLRGEFARRHEDQRAQRLARAAPREADGCVESRCSIGSTKPAVLPVPVCAPARRSPPARTAGIACAWIGVGTV